LGSNQQNRAYCTKDNDFTEIGTLTRRVQGSEESAEVVRLILVEGWSPSRIAIECQEYASYCVNHFYALQLMHKEMKLHGQFEIKNNNSREIESGIVAESQEE